MNDDFYVGYQPKAPVALARRTRLTVWGLLAVALLLAALLVFGQSPFAKSTFEFGESKNHEGQIVEWPYPMLVTTDTTYLLVNPGKHGASEVVKGLDGKQATLQGTLIERGSQRMLELVPGTLRATGDAVVNRAQSDLGAVTLTGEIVD